ncbi:MAG: nucleotide exchange factor GrpE [Flavobacteriales bacterium]|nr:nucleotide exchange factor GrpE [Flavobacteriales bacterium]|tara:strand:+ start:4231 stop:4713 length:483 start_codon:yes stop_codon:yes gene_type:complete
MTKNKQKKNKAESKTKKENFKEKFNDLNDKHLRLHAEFENFKRRTAKERIDLYSTAGENILTSILPILDDFERAIKTLENEKENEGMLLIYSKFKTILEQKGLKIMDNPIGKDLNTDYHEAITNIPSPSKKMTGKIIDVIENGYLLNDKIIRFAKVVVAK